MLMAVQTNGSRCDAPSLLLVGGAPASGKSMLCRQLSQRYGAAPWAKDALKEILFETLGTGEALGPARAQWSRSLSDASFGLLFHLAATLLQSPGPPRVVILEGNFRPGEHEAAVQGLLTASGACLIQVLCQASAATRAARLAGRLADPVRHPAHRDARIDAGAPTPGFLALPGARLTFDSDSDRVALPELYRALDALLSSAARAP
jgi:predicted kinase